MKMKMPDFDKKMKYEHKTLFMIGQNGRLTFVKIKRLQKLRSFGLIRIR